MPCVPLSLDLSQPAFILTSRAGTRALDAVLQDFLASLELFAYQPEGARSSLARRPTG